MVVRDLIFVIVVRHKKTTLMIYLLEASACYSNFA